MGTPLEPTRRNLLKGTAALGIAGTPLGTLANTMEAADRSFVNLGREPDLVRAWGKDEEIQLVRSGDAWSGGGVEVRYANGEVTVRSSVGLVRLQLRWKGDLSGVDHVLGDHWERSYGDLAWRGREVARALPWYFMATSGDRTHGYGVRTAPGAMVFWTADNEGISLWADLRSGGSPVNLGEGTLRVAQVVCREGKSGESAFAATRAFCRTMCPKPLLADHPIYGTNDWNYAYGNNSADLIAGVSGLISELSPDPGNRPYSVIDDGWSSGGQLGHGPWVGNERFGDMGKFAERLKGLGVRPGIWFRPLTELPGQSDAMKVTHRKGVLDPTVPETIEHVKEHFRRFAGWGYEMVKHDFTSWDMFGRWGNGMGPNVTNDGWRFHDDTRTNAEIVLDLYRAIRESAGAMRLIGCNTFTHLAAGLHEVQRTGDDTSGRSWERTRHMGVNTLGFRAAHHDTFYAVDPDIVAITRDLPWDLNEQWLRLVSQSGTALFVSVEPEFIDETHKKALREALALAAKSQTVGEPLDWQRTNTPREWKLLGKRVEFDWMGESGAWPYGA